MLLEQYDWGLEARTLQIIFALVLGVVLGIAAQISRFCLRRAVDRNSSDRGQAGAVWLTALATAIVGFQVASANGLVNVEGHRYLDTGLPVLAILIGGLAFGVGMILTRGCASRLTVLAATGNLRAVSVLVIFAIVAHATLKGVFAPLRTSLGAITAELPVGSLAEVPFGTASASALAVLAAGFLFYRHRPALTHVALGIVIGLVPVFGWATTSVLLFDEFDPLAVQSAAFTLPWTETLFWTIASTALPAGFGTGLIGGVLLGSFLSAAVRKELKLESFESPAQTVRYALGAVLMGFGGVLAGGCTIGAGLSGSATLSIAALLALASITVGATVASRVTEQGPRLVAA
ncbi:YeeE/YedE family protein [Actibacterium pelagium]|uniref:Lipocalin n=1 Tax=Actibacterium pelagium TaxID=2029103 RepID=A0A917AG76_9RHOB|nr:YeeE/YedE family protein [Actibacterium pelagium]GGE50386.1 lipocalin [Actibacterium pelagium]